MFVCKRCLSCIRYEPLENDPVRVTGSVWTCPSAAAGFGRGLWKTVRRARLRELFEASDRSRGLILRFLWGVVIQGQPAQRSAL